MSDSDCGRVWRRDMSRHVPTIGLALLLAGLLALVWGLFVVIAVLLVAKSFPAGSPPLPPTAPQSVAHGRVAEWSRWLHNSRRDDHSRWRLAQKLSLLAIETLAFREQCSPQEISRRLRDGSLDIPPQVRAYLHIGSAPFTPRLR